MTRIKAREIAVRLAFALGATEYMPDDALDDFFEEEHYATLGEEDELYSERPGKKQLEYIRSLVTLCYDRRIELDRVIEKHARGWKPERITRTAAAVLRCALAEILYVEDVPPAVAINEAVELAKSYEEPETVAFINGVLGGFMRADEAETVSETVAEPETETVDE